MKAKLSVKVSSLLMFLLVIFCFSSVWAQDYNMEELIEDFTNSNFAISLKATNILVELGNEALPVFEQLLLESDDEVIHMKTLHALRRVGTVESIGPLSLGLQSGLEVNREIAEEGIVDLLQHGEEAYKEVLLLNHNKLNNQAMELLLNSGWTYEAIIDYLLEQLETRNYYTQLGIMQVLGNMEQNSEPAVNSLLTIIDNENFDLIIRLAGLEAVSKIDPSAVSLHNWSLALTELSIKNFRRLYWTAYESLVAGGNSGVPGLIEVLSSSEPQLRARASAVLGDIGRQAEEAIPHLELALSDVAWFVQKEAALALSKIDPSLELEFDIKDSHITMQPVTLENFDSEIRLSNGIISMTIGKKNAKVTKLVVDERNILDSKGAYFDANAPDYINIDADKFEVVKESRDLVHVKGVKYATKTTPFEIESHYILRSGDSGYYAFLVYKHNNEYSGELIQTRQVIRVDTDLMPNMVVSNARQGQLPTEQMLASAENVMDATDRLLDGSVYSKYNWAVYEGEHYVHGMVGDNIGLWVIKGSNEYQPSGPVKQNLTVHSENVVLAMLHSTHYGSKSVKVEPDSGWEKIYGPFFVYVNKGENLTELWTDAKLRAVQEQQVWPYEWLDVPEYNVDRGSVTGTLRLSDNTIPVGAWVIIGEPETRWEEQAKDYLYWSKVNSDGTFTVDNVRAGEYSLWVWKSEILGEFIYPDIQITSNQTTVLEPLVWEPFKHGTLIWEVGIPNRSAKEFFRADHYRNWGVWFKYYEHFPHGVNYYPGKSDYTKDWNFVQPTIITTPTGNRQAEPWRVHFDLPEGIQGEKAVLTIAIAGVGNCSFDALVNGQELITRSYSADASIHRSGISGVYYLEEIEFDTSILKQSGNILELKVYGNNSLSSGILWDYLRLEVVITSPSQGL